MSRLVLSPFIDSAPAHYSWLEAYVAPSLVWPLTSRRFTVARLWRCIPRCPFEASKQQPQLDGYRNRSHAWWVGDFPPFPACPFLGGVIGGRVPNSFFVLFRRRSHEQCYGLILTDCNGLSYEFHIYGCSNTFNPFLPIVLNTGCYSNISHRGTSARCG